MLSLFTVRDSGEDGRSFKKGNSCLHRININRHVFIHCACPEIIATCISIINCVCLYFLFFFPFVFWVNFLFFCIFVFSFKERPASIWLHLSNVLFVLIVNFNWNILGQTHNSQASQWIIPWKLWCHQWFDRFNLLFNCFHIMGKFQQAVLFCTPLKQSERGLSSYI